MPSRNIIRHDVADSYYHVYVRGVNKRPIFMDDNDKDKFISMFERYLSFAPSYNSVGVKYDKHLENIELLAYCLMDNHFHLFMHQKNKGGLTKFMRSLQTSYVRYFNLHHSRRGPLFESRYRASRIEDEAYFSHISRYIHLNRRNWKYYPYSSVNYYRQGNEPDWINTATVLKLFNSDRKAYIQFLYDFQDYKNSLAEISYDLSDV